MNNEDLNNKLADLDDHHPEFMPEALKSYYKVLPYYSFGWRFVDFNKKIWLGISPYTEEDGKNVVPWIGFTPRLRWNYTRWQATDDQSKVIKQLCEELVLEPSVAKATEVFNYIQGLRLPG